MTLIPRTMRQLLSIGATALVAVLATPHDVLPGACTHVACKAHDRWCYHDGYALQGAKSYSNEQRTVITEFVPPADQWAETDDEGDPIEYDVIFYKIYPDCASDCDSVEDLHTTGAPSGTSYNWEGIHKTKCSGPDSP